MMVKQFIKKVTPVLIVDSYKEYKRRIGIKRYFGNKVICSLCEFRFEQFAHFGPNRRVNAKCPNCGSLERHRLLWRYLVEKTDLFDNSAPKKLLHFAPEKIFYDLFSKTESIQYTPCDYSPELFRFKGKSKIEKIDITSIEFEDNLFDVVICLHVLEHIPNDAKAMCELFRVMKKGAWGIFQVPIDYDRLETYEDFTIRTKIGKKIAFGQEDHVRWYGQDYKDRLVLAGFTVYVDDFVKKFTSEQLYEYGLNGSELIYFCRK